MYSYIEFKRVNLERKLKYETRTFKKELEPFQHCLQGNIPIQDKIHFSRFIFVKKNKRKLIFWLTIIQNFKYVNYTISSKSTLNYIPYSKHRHIQQKFFKMKRYFS